MKIHNFEELSVTNLRQDALKVAEIGLQTIDTHKVLEESLKLEDTKLSVCGQEFTLSPNGRLIAILIGKCAGDAAFAFEKILGNQISKGVALGVGPLTSNLQPLTSSPESKLNIIKYIEGTHPMPSERNIEGTRQILETLQGLKEQDTVLFLISGGGSTLLVQPPCIAQKMRDLLLKESGMLEKLFDKGATIQEINTARKHMSLARGGFLAEAAYPAQVISIIFSDVPGNELGFISSGPTVKDDTTVKDAEAILRKYDLELCLECLTETPKEAKYFERVYNILTISNKIALQKMQKFGKSLGYKSTIKNTCLVGEARDIAKQISQEINSSEPGTLLLYCGETTVTINESDHDQAKGGRNQELALAALSHLQENCLIISLASDGKDNGPHAGAIADIETLNNANSQKLNIEEYLNHHQSTIFYEKVNSLIETGPTGSNVSDLIIAIKK